MNWKNAFRKLFYMSKTERNGVIVLIVLILVVFIVRFVVSDWFDDNDYTNAIEEKIERIENQPEPEIGKIDNNQRISNRNGEQTTVEKKSPTKTETDHKVEYFKFDPNTATYNELLKLGFSGKLANTLINYREKGGHFKKPTDILKLYNIDSSLYLKIEPYVEIPQEKRVAESAIVAKQMIEINSADSMLFVQLKGVGPVLASRICKYRKALGGFVRIDQICEVYKFPIETFEQIKEQLTVDPLKIEKIDINFAEINELKRHPYCNFALARRIIDYRAKTGSFKSIDQLLSDSVLTITEFEKLQSYLAVK